jgi:hypothetical protein
MEEDSWVYVVEIGRTMCWRQEERLKMLAVFSRLQSKRKSRDESICDLDISKYTSTRLHVPIPSSEYFISTLGHPCPPSRSKYRVRALLHCRCCTIHHRRTPIDLFARDTQTRPAMAGTRHTVLSVLLSPSFVLFCGREGEKWPRCAWKARARGRGRVVHADKTRQHKTYIQA